MYSWSFALKAYWASMTTPQNDSAPCPVTHQPPSLWAALGNRVQNCGIVAPHGRPFQPCWIAVAVTPRPGSPCGSGRRRRRSPIRCTSRSGGRYRDVGGRYWVRTSDLFGVNEGKAAGQRAQNAADLEIYF